MSHRIKIITPPNSHTLATLSAAKLQLDITDTNSDAVLTAFIASGSSVIESYLGRPVFVQEVEETWRQMSWKQRDTLCTTYAPIVALTSVTENQIALVENTDFEIEYSTGVFYRTSGGFRWRWGHEVVIHYTTGYAAVPAVIAQVCLDLVAFAYRARLRDPTIQLELTEGVGRIAYFDRGLASFTLDDAMKLQLQPYMAIIP